MARTPLPPPAVALVPGFFGFDHRGATTYFADRFVAGLRAVLEARGLHGVPVLSVSTLGIAGLAQRQGDLLRELGALESARADGRSLGGPRTWHLVGHSTGGVDAALLLRDAPLVKRAGETSFAATGWGDAADLVDRVASVVTIAAPHFGTGLAESPLASFVAGHPSLPAIRDMAAATLDLARRGDLGSRIRFALSATPGLTKMPSFLLQMSLMNELAHDLRPDVVGRLSTRPVRASRRDRAFSIATVAPRPAAGHADRLFHDMWCWTSDGARRAPTMDGTTLDAELDLRLPTQRSVVLPRIDRGDNDGVATTERQVFGQVIGLVVADHVDVLGRYRRTSLIDGKVIDPGLLTSGADFGDDEFFALLLRIGDRLATSIGASEKE